MRTFKIAPTSPGHELHHLWGVIAIEDDGSEVTLDTYDTMAEAEAAMAVLAREELDIGP
jgi:hypothetical protein